MNGAEKAERMPARIAAVRAFLVENGHTQHAELTDPQIAELVGWSETDASAIARTRRVLKLKMPKAGPDDDLSGFFGEERAKLQPCRSHGKVGCGDETCRNQAARKATRNQT